MTEWVGYMAMFFLVISFIPRQIKLIRWMNLVACLFFVAYGVLLGWKWPLILSNGMIAAIHVYHLLVPGQPGRN